MKRGQGTSPTNLSGRKSKRRNSRGSRLAAAAEGIFSEILSPSLQTKSSETSSAVPTNEHPGREAPPGRTSARISHALHVSRDTPKKESRTPVFSPQSTRGSRSCAVSSVPSTVARRTRPSTTKTSTRRSTSKRPQEKEPIGHDGQSDIIGHEVKNLATLLYPAVEPQEELDLTSSLEQQVSEADKYHVYKTTDQMACVYLARIITQYVPSKPMIHLVRDPSRDVNKSSNKTICTNMQEQTYIHSISLGKMKLPLR